MWESKEQCWLVNWSEDAEMPQPPATAWIPIRLWTGALYPINVPRLLSMIGAQALCPSRDNRRICVLAEEGLADVWKALPSTYTKNLSLSFFFWQTSSGFVDKVMTWVTLQLCVVTESARAELPGIWASVECGVLWVCVLHSFIVRVGTLDLFTLTDWLTDWLMCDDKPHMELLTEALPSGLTSGGITTTVLARNWKLNTAPLVSGMTPLTAESSDCILPLVSCFGSQCIWTGLLPHLLVSLGLSVSGLLILSCPFKGTLSLKPLLQNCRSFIVINHYDGWSPTIWDVMTALCRCYHYIWRSVMTVIDDDDAITSYEVLWCMPSVMTWLCQDYYKWFRWCVTSASFGTKIAGSSWS